MDARLRRAIEAGALPRDLLICGPAGTGKTFGILTVLHCLCADNPGLRVLVCRKTRASLSESALVTYEQEVLPADGMQSVAAGQSRRHRSSYRYPNGTEVVLAGLDNPTRVTSTAWDIVFVNESIELTEEDWETLGSRLNRPGRDPRFGWLVGDTNPGDPAHWLRRRAAEGLTALWDTGHEANPALHDGRGWTAAGVAYRARLANLKGARRRRYFEGVWAAGEGQWFDQFDHAAHVTADAEYHPGLPVWLAVDSGVHTGAVWFQVRERPAPFAPLVTVLGDFYAFNRGAYDVANAIKARGGALCGGRLDRGVSDPAGGAATGVGATVLGEYRRAGLALEPWPVRPVADGLALACGLLDADPPGLLVHPRCAALLDAFANYKRARRQGQWVDRPEDPQHPYEDLMDALRGGLLAKFPQGLVLPAEPATRPFTRVFY